jgi:hypothetical protein
MGIRRAAIHGEGEGDADTAAQRADGQPPNRALHIRVRVILVILTLLAVLGTPQDAV